ncbi:MAG TPA: hypothetical protein VFZ77_11450 [Acidimicrobiales bacterium]
MLTVHCPRHGREVLLSARRITAIEPAGGALRVRWVCWCGHRGAHLTGRLHAPVAESADAA